MFAAALWREREQRLYLFRDATGQKPLYWIQQAIRFGFASEIRGLRAAGLDLQVETGHLAAYMALRYLPGPQTAFRGVQELPPGHLLSVRPGQAPRVRRWDCAEEAVEEDLATLARRAVERACRADVPVGIYLSGGVDSAFLARTAAARGLAGPALTLAFEQGLEQALGRDELQRVAAWLRGWQSASARARSDGLRRLFTPPDMRGLVNPALYAEWDRDLADLEPLTSDDLPEILATQCQGWLPGWVSGRHEKIAMARAIEVRMPLLDRTLRD
jgi:asparagine synthase (glutamine-hydrolysing)